MATLGWRTGSTVKQLLLAQYSRFEPYQLLRLLHWPAPGNALPAGTTLRFRADLSGRFAGHEFSGLRSYRLSGRVARDVIEIETPNYCIASLLGPLPEPFTEWVRDLKRARSPAMADFLDMFNHRLNLLRFQLKSRQTLGLNKLPPEQTEHAAQLAAIMGMGLPQLAAQIDLPRRVWLGLAGLLANCRRSAAAIAQVTSLYIGARVRLVPLVGAWHAIAPQDRMQLGRRGHVLGRSSLLGRRAWDQSARIRLVVEPLDYPRFCQLLPPGHPLATPAPANGHATYSGLVGLLRLLLNGLHDCEMELTLAPGAAPPARLLSGGSPANIGLRLRYSAWLGAAPATPPASARTVRFLIPAFATTEPA
jgi:type VI secretion system protein ImpH